MVRKDKNFKLSISLLMALVLLMLPSAALAADVNYGSGDYSGTTGKGSKDWKYNTGGRGVRISIYFVKGGKENFADPNCKIYPIGRPTDFAKYEMDYNAKPEYIVDDYTGRSVFEYMNRGGLGYKQKSASIEPFHYVKASEPICQSMPDIMYADRSDWERWFTGNDFENIPVITELCGQKITAEDFKNGIYKTQNGEVLEGTYEIFFEPFASAVVDDNGMFLTLRDAIRYNEHHAAMKAKDTNYDYYDGKIVNWLNLIFVFLANKAYLVTEELAPLNMKPNLYDGKPFLVRHNYETKERDRAEIKREMKPGGKIYDSMGVGTVLRQYNPPVVHEPEPLIIPELPDPAEPKPPVGVLRAEERGNEKFDAEAGIPATEKLYAQVRAEEYLYELEISSVKADVTRTFLVKKTYHKTWKDPDYYVDCSSCENGWVDDPDNPGGKKECTADGCEDGRVLVPGSWHSADETITQEHILQRSYCYWVIDRFAMYALEGAKIYNGALEGGSTDIEVDAGKYIAPEIVELYQPAEHIVIDPFDEALRYDASEGKYVLWLADEHYSGSSVPPGIDLQSEAEKAISQYKVKNDSLVINFRKKDTSGRVIDNKVTILQEEYIPGPGDTTEAARRNYGYGPAPNGMPESPYSHEDALYKNGLVIPADTPNGTYPTTGQVIYKRYPVSLNPTMGDTVEKEIENMGHVTVHTPVVCNSGVRDEYARSQQLGEKESDRSDLVLGRDSLIKFLVKDYMHRDIKGYRTGDFTKYVKGKYVRFPFDINIKDASGRWQYVPANTWHEVDKSQEYIDISVPVWVDEGDYTVNFKVVAINAPEDIDDPSDAGFGMAPGDAGSRQEYMANKDMDNYVAYRDSKVRVVGRVENFRITDINDYPLWESVFRKRQGSSAHTGINFTVGGDCSGKYGLPIMEGSHPTQGDRGALKTGYAFRFTLDTVGEYFEDKDYIKIIPTFWFVGRNGGEAIPVDIYYNEYFNGKENILVKIGSAKDKTNRHVIENTDIYRNMPEQAIKRTSELLGISERQFRGRKVDIGTYDEIILTKDLRLFIGDTVSHPFARGSAEEKRVWKSVQRWYGEYRLPDKVYVAPAGMDITRHPESSDGIDGKESFWLKDGYIIVNFRIETYQQADDGTVTGPVLGYWHGNYDRWMDEGFEYVQTDHYGKVFRLDSGNVVFYYADKRSADDYRTGVNR